MKSRWHVGMMELAYKISIDSKYKNYDDLMEIHHSPILRNSDGIAIINIYDGDTRYEILVDDNEWHHVSLVDFSFMYTGYAIVQRTCLVQPMHEYILGKKPGFVIDHKNRNKLDNRVANLRYLTFQQNLWNRSFQKNTSSKYGGVSECRTLNNGVKQWRSGIMCKGRKIHMGTFDDEIKAAKARDIAALKYFGEAANLNFDSPEQILEYSSNLDDMSYMEYVSDLRPEKSKNNELHKLLYDPGSVSDPVYFTKPMRIRREPESDPDEDLFKALCQREHCSDDDSTAAKEIYTEEYWEMIFALE